MLDRLLVLGALLALVSVAGTRWTARFGVPAMLLFVGLGMLAGSSGAGVAFGDYSLAHQLGTVALAIILLAGGMETPSATLRSVLAPALLLSTVGVLIKAGVVAAAVVGALGWTWADGLLLGAILAPTDAAAVFQVLAGKGLRPRIASVLEAESGTNDPVAIYLTGALVLASTQAGEGGPSPLGVALQLGLGLGYGWLAGRAFQRFIAHVRSTEPGLVAVSVLAAGLGVFGLANLLGGNGFLAAYVMGVVVGDGRLPHDRPVRAAVDSAAWFAQIGLFLLLGLLSFPDRAIPQLGVAVFTTAVIVFVARPVAVVVSLWPLQLSKEHRFTGAEWLLLAWGGLKGAVPVVLAIVPLLAGHPHGEALFHVVLLVVLMATALQGTTLVPLARRLGLLDAPPPSPEVQLAVEGLPPVSGGLRDLSLTPGHPIIGRSVMDLGLPEDVVIAAVLRQGHLLAARGSTVLAEGDHLYLVVADPAADLPTPLEDPPTP